MQCGQSVQLLNVKLVVHHVASRLSEVQIKIRPWYCPDIVNMNKPFNAAPPPSNPKMIKSSPNKTSLSSFSCCHFKFLFAQYEECDTALHRNLPSREMFCHFSYTSSPAPRPLLLLSLFHYSKFNMSPSAAWLLTTIAISRRTPLRLSRHVISRHKLQCTYIVRMGEAVPP